MTRCHGVLACALVSTALVLPYHRARNVVRWSTPSNPVSTPDVVTKDVTKDKDKDKDETDPTNFDGKHQVLLFDDPVNTREYVSRILCTKCGLSETQSFDVMMMAHNHGVGIVGTYWLERAEAYVEVMRDAGLLAALVPLDGSGGDDSSAPE